MIARSLLLVVAAAQLLVVAASLLTACIWTLDNPRDPERCDPACGPGTSCFLGECLEPESGWVLIRAGSFSMGSPVDEPCRMPDGGATRETLHHVTLTHGFQLGQTEVTEAEFSARLGHTTWTTSCGASCPAGGVSWHEAAAYCSALSTAAGLTRCYSCNGSGSGVRCDFAAAFRQAKIYDCPGYRLPTEAEWEYAYRAGTTTALYNGPIVNCTGTDAGAAAIGWHGGGSMRPVGQKQPNAWGLHDMAGNIAEWVHDRFEEDLGGAAVTDPVHESSGFGVHRGGCHGGPATHLRAAYRQGGNAPDAADDYTGFRCARSR